VNSDSQQLRQRGEHCRHLADSQFDERVSSILHSMAKDYEEQARDLDSGPPLKPNGEDSAR
jgi:hypothetical protein